MTNLNEEYNQIPELYSLKHVHDSTIPEHGFNYTEDLLKRSVSNHLYRNDNLSEFLTDLNKLMVALIDTAQPIRNLFSWSHSKYFNKHGR